MRLLWLPLLAFIWASPATRLANEITNCPQIFRIDAFDSQGRHLRTATAFGTPSGKALLTAAHVVRDARRVEALSSQGERLSLRKFVFAPAPSDVALLQLSQRSKLNASAWVTATSTPNQTIRVLAHTVDMGFITVPGSVIAQLQHPLFGDVLSISAPLIEGMSGAAVVDAACRVIGIASFGTEGQEHRYYAIPAAAFATLQSVD